MVNRKRLLVSILVLVALGAAWSLLCVSTVPSSLAGFTISGLGGVGLGVSIMSLLSLWYVVRR